MFHVHEQNVKKNTHTHKHNKKSIKYCFFFLSARDTLYENNSINDTHYSEKKPTT